MKITDWIYNHAKEIMVCCAIVFIVVLIILGFFEPSTFTEYCVKCCQEQVNICDMKYGYWGFSVVCSDDYFGWGNKNKVIDQHFHRTLERCEESLKFYISYKNCGVLK